MTYEHEPEEQVYEAPREAVFELRPDGSEPGVVGSMNPDEIEVFHRMRTEQAHEESGGMGATKQRQGSMPLMMETMAAAKAEVAARG